MKYLKYFLNFISINIFLISTVVADIDISAFVVKDKTTLQFSEFSYLPVGSKLFLSILSTENRQTELLVKTNNKISKFADISLVAGTDLIFPGNDKNIELDKEGQYAFILRDKTSQKELTSIILIVGDEDFSKKLNIKFSQKNSSSSSNISMNLPTYDTEESLQHGKISLLHKTPIIVSQSSRSAGSEIYKKFAKSVVLILTENASGSGILISNNTVLTNKHVVENNEFVTVILKPKGFSKIENARRIVGTVIRFDEITDLALVSLPSKIKTPVAKFSDPSKLEIAMKTHAIGHPRGELWTYTEGVVSQIHPDYEWQIAEDYVNIADVIQTQTPINPGNSGGPLFNSKGQLIGINSFGRPDSPGLNYAVAITSINEFVSKNNTIYAKRKKAEDNKDCWAIDFNQNGLKDDVACDTNQNGRPEYIIIDEDGDGLPDAAIFDEDESGESEMMVSRVILDNGKAIDVWRIDPDETGRWTGRGFDYDLDGEVDEWEQI